MLGGGGGFIEREEGCRTDDVEGGVMQMQMQKKD